MNITENELVAALQEAMQKQSIDSEGMTSEEVADILGCSRSLAVKKLKTLAKTGQLIVGHRRDYRLDGVPCKIPVYRLAA